MKKSLLCLTITVTLAIPIIMRATTQGDVVVNEIAWMGSTTSANDEWMELKNTTDQQIDLTGWTLRFGDQNIKLKGTILARGFYLLERTDNNSVSAVTASLIYKGTLSNGGQDLILYDSSNNVIDEVNSTSGWPAGNNTTKQTMEKAAGGWQTSYDPNGTPKAENSSGAVIIPPTPKPAKITPIKIPRTPKVKALPKTKKTDNTYLSALSQPTVNTNTNSDILNTDAENTLNPWSLFLGALAITIISATIVLLLKLKILKKHERSQSF